MKRVNKLIFFIVLSIFCLMACSLETYRGNKDIVIEDALEYLASNKCDGRLVGTKGNKLAEEYIADKFKEFGLDTFDERHYVPYEQKTVTIDESKVCLELENGKKFIYGKNFVEAKIKNENIMLPIYKNDEGVDCIILTSNNANEYLDNEHVKGVLVLKEDLQRAAPSTMKIGNKNVFSINKGTYESLKKCVGQHLKMSMVYKQNKETVNNVVGILPGKDRGKAIIITAHLDHAGSIGDSIYRGALDNCSGVAVMLDIASKLSEYYKNGKIPSRDLIFCAVNGEETNLKGSYKISKALSEKYSNVIDINLDCVGEKGTDEIIIDYIGTKEVEQMCREMVDVLDHNNIKSKYISNYGISDHISFGDSILISTGFNFDIIHKTKDTLDQVDSDWMKTISYNICEFLKQFSQKDKSKIVKTQTQFDNDREIDIELEKLKFGEYKFINNNDRPFYIAKLNTNGTLNDINTHFDDKFTFIPQVIENKALSDCGVNASRSVYYNSPKPEEYQMDKVYRRDNIINDVVGLYLTYGCDDEPRIYVNMHMYLKDSSLEMQLSEEINTYGNNKDTININDNTLYKLIRDESDLMDNLIYTKEDEKAKYILTIQGCVIEEKSNKDIEKFIEEYNIEKVFDEFIRSLMK
ncbi:M28 family peptidase [Clostridiaceae bacterium M8S5]|nr:M28 family peptidase [Clostridiaceae bacterium M8S5]